LAVGIQEQFEESGIEIVVMRHVPPGAPWRHSRREPGSHGPIKGDQPDMRRAQTPETAPLGERDQIVDGARLYDQTVVHEELAELESGVESECPFGTFVGKPDGNTWSCPVAE
jgi:hypothetical protein